LQHRGEDAAILTGSASAEPPTKDCIDYIFTDPPFGENIYYADLNYLVESWHGVLTNSEPEAIIDQAKRKTLRDYQDLMRQAFRSYYHWLKPGRWMTVEFHNSHNSVWNAIQEALSSVGFVVADVRTLDKQQLSYRQTTAASAAQQDLVISAYKPATTFERQFAAEAGTPAGAWDFVRQHLAQLPAVVLAAGSLETIAERQDYLLFDRMVAFHIQRGATVPLSAAEFYAGLRSRFVERDGMFFLPDQTPAYDQARLQAGQVAQLTLFVNDEKSSLQWLRQQLDPALSGHPQTYQELAAPVPAPTAPGPPRGAAGADRAAGAELPAGRPGPLVCTRPPTRPATWRRCATGRCCGSFAAPWTARSASSSSARRPSAPASPRPGASATSRPSSPWPNACRSRCCKRTRSC
jgi:hypothetical protein